MCTSPLLAYRVTQVAPQSLEAEQAVLGGLLLDNSALDLVADIVSEVDFYRSDHRTLFRCIHQLIQQNKPADVLTLSDALRLEGKLDEVGGQTYIGSLALNTPSADIRRIRGLLNVCVYGRSPDKDGLRDVPCTAFVLRRSSFSVLQFAPRTAMAFFSSEI